MDPFGLIDDHLVAKQKVWFPHWYAGLVPTEPAANRAWRQRNFFLQNKADQRALRKACAEDPLFWIYGFSSIFNAADESGEPGGVPFLLYPYQVSLFTALYYAMFEKRCPVRVKKPRKLGLSWLCTALFQWAWQFKKNMHLLVGSHRENEVEGSMATSRAGSMVGEWSLLMPKFDFLQLSQPRWLLPAGFIPRVEPWRTSMKIVSPENSIIWGTSAASAAGHGERGFASYWDEASRTQELGSIIGGLQEFAPCRLWISTIGNLDHSFSTTLKEAPGVMQLSPEWYMHPIYSDGMTINVDTGARSSPWLERKLSEINHDPIQANQLYFADESQQQGGYYSKDVFRITVGTSDKPGTVCDPFYVGEFDVLDTKDGPRVMRFCSQQTGRWKFWFHSDASGRPPRNTRYVAGIDTAAGTTDTGGRGASNSVITFADWGTGEVVAEGVFSGLQPYELARMAVAAGLWFEGDDFMGALLVPESNGVGSQTIDCLVKKHRYMNVWQSDPSEAKYGWFKRGGDGLNDKGSSRMAFGLHQEMICDGRLKERSMDCIKEMRHYQHAPNGRGAPIHSASILSDDPSNARDNHGDRVITRICLCQVMQKSYKISLQKGRPAWGSYRWANERDEREKDDANRAMELA